MVHAFDSEPASTGDRLCIVYTSLQALAETGLQSASSPSRSLSSCMNCEIEGSPNLLHTVNEGNMARRISQLADLDKQSDYDTDGIIGKAWDSIL